MELKDPVVYLKSPVWDFGGGSWPWNWNWTEYWVIRQKWFLPPSASYCRHYSKSRPLGQVNHPKNTTTISVTAQMRLNETERWLPKHEPADQANLLFSQKTSWRKKGEHFSFPDCSLRNFALEEGGLRSTEEVLLLPTQRTRVQSLFSAFFSLLLSLRTVLRTNPFSAKQWISEMQLLWHPDLSATKKFPEEARLVPVRYWWRSVVLSHVLCLPMTRA